MVDNGQNASGAQRRMRSTSGEYVLYDLYQDSNRTVPFTASSGTVGTGSGIAQTLQLYGRIPLQTAAPGDFSVVVVVTIQY